jgi:ligand-binding sensor domain-containing protein
MGRFSAWAVALLATGPVPLQAQGRDWSPEDRAIIGDFSRITALAASRDRLFVVTGAAVLSYEALGRRWLGPWSPGEPGALQGVTAALADLLDGSLWLVTRSGWLRFDPSIRLWEAGTVAGTVLDAALDANAPGSGLFLRTSAGWFSVQRGGGVFPGSAPGRPVRPATVDDAVRSNPAIQATSALTLLNRFHRVRYTAAARGTGFTGEGWYLGTSGAGLFYLPDGAGIPEPLPFGLPSDVTDAVFAGNGGVWVVTERTPIADPALTFVASDFSIFKSLQGPRATGLPFSAARRVVGRESELWLATDVGVIRIAPQADSYARYDESRGLPDSRVLDLAQRRGRIVAGTVHGLASFDSTGFVRLAPDFSDAASAVELGGDTVWVGTGLGLFAAVPGVTDLVVVEPAHASAAMQERVMDLAWRADTLVALLQDRLLWRDPQTGRFTLGPLLGDALGRPHSLVSGRAGLYIAGELGVGLVGLATPLRRVLTTPGDLPGSVTGVAVDDDYLWVTTLNGLVRLRLDAIGS